MYKLIYICNIVILYSVVEAHLEFLYIPRDDGTKFI